MLVENRVLRHRGTEGKVVVWGLAPVAVLDDAANGFLPLRSRKMTGSHRPVIACLRSRAETLPPQSYLQEPVRSHLRLELRPPEIGKHPPPIGYADDQRRGLDAISKQRG